MRTEVLVLIASGRCRRLSTAGCGTCRFKVRYGTSGYGACTEWLDLGNTQPTLRVDQTHLLAKAELKRILKNS